jgi:hypothetical protein
VHSDLSLVLLACHCTRCVGDTLFWRAFATAVLRRLWTNAQADSVVIGQIELNQKMTLAFTCKKCDTRNIYKVRCALSRGPKSIRI